MNVKMGARKEQKKEKKPKKSVAEMKKRKFVAKL